MPKDYAQKMKPANGTAIWAIKEGDVQETMLGNVAFFPNANIGRRGIQHIAERKFTAHNGNAREKIYSGVVESEGKGYDSLNMYDQLHPKSVLSLMVNLINRDAL